MRKFLGIIEWGWYYSAVVFLIGLLTFIFGKRKTSYILWFLSSFILFFFRDPVRNVESSPNEFLSPADGKVIGIDEVTDEKTGEKFKRVKIFLSVFDVHVNRLPVDGKLIAYNYYPGQFHMAFDKEADENERLESIWQTKWGKIKITQIAGWVARRIVFVGKLGNEYKKGYKFGMIRFGSRTDLYLPLNVQILVKEGDRVYGGLTKVARIQE